MFDHVSIGVGDLERSRAFYDATLGALGYRRLYADAASLGYGLDSVGWWVGASPAPVAENSASGLHFCFAAPSRQNVEAFHAAALAEGGRDNGGPGVREAYAPDYFAAFVIDPDGYRLEAYCKGA
jgi:catechol 2,3-dioxygenase-like lactoylglutathione lyase family enzyme